MMMSTHTTNLYIHTAVITNKDNREMRKEKKCEKIEYFIKS